MYYLDAFNEKSGKDFYVTRNLDYPLMKDRHGNYRIKSGEMIRVCMTSDFFYEKADPYRQHCFDIMKKRRDVVFYLLTKRANRIKECLPPDIASFENIFMNVTCENKNVPTREFRFFYPCLFVTRVFSSPRCLRKSRSRNTFAPGKSNRSSSVARTMAEEDHVILLG